MQRKRVMPMQRKPNKGFTLIELMIAVAIVAILAMVAVPSYTSYIMRGHLADATSGLERLQPSDPADLPDLVILDVMLPDEDGYQILGRLRETAATRTVPVIMVTAKTSEIDVVKGLDHGADDYLCKPFGIMEFISRVKAVLRRASTAPASTTTLRFGDITLDDVARTVTVDGEPVELTFKEYSLLHFFLEHPEEVLARERIMKAVWDTDDLLESRTIDMHVRTLRQKLGHAGDAICTVRKVGYKLSAKGTEAGEDA